VSLVKMKESASSTDKTSMPATAQLSGVDEHVVRMSTNASTTLVEKENSVKMSQVGSAVTVKMVGEEPTAPVPSVGSRVKMEESASSSTNKSETIPAIAQLDGLDQTAVRMSTNVTYKLWGLIGVGKKLLEHAIMDSVKIRWEATSASVIQDTEEKTVQGGWVVPQNPARMKAPAISILVMSI